MCAKGFVGATERARYSRKDVHPASTARNPRSGAWSTHLVPKACLRVGEAALPPPGRGVLVERAVGRPPAILLPSGGGRRPVFFLGRLWGGLTLATEGATVAAAKIKRDGCDATLSVRASMKVGRLTGRGAGVWIAVVPRTAIF